MTGKPDGRDNLIPLNRRSQEEQREISRRAGIASGVARRKRRTMREIAEALAQNPDASYEDRLTAIVAAQFSKAADGDTRAAEFIRSLLGEDIPGAVSGNVTFSWGGASAGDEPAHSEKSAKATQPSDDVFSITWGGDSCRMIE